MYEQTKASSEHIYLQCSVTFSTYNRIQSPHHSKQKKKKNNNDNNIKSAH